MLPSKSKIKFRNLQKLASKSETKFRRDWDNSHLSLGQNKAFWGHLGLFVAIWGQNPEFRNL